MRNPNIYEIKEIVLSKFVTIFLNTVESAIFGFINAAIPSPSVFVIPLPQPATQSAANVPILTNTQGGPVAVASARGSRIFTQTRTSGSNSDDDDRRK